MIEKEIEDDGGTNLRAQIRNDEEWPINLIMTDGETGDYARMRLSQDSAKMLSKWLRAALDLQRWC